MSEYAVDGHDMDDPAGRWRLTSATTLPTWGAPRLPSVEVPGRVGVLPLPAMSTAPSTLVLGLLVTDSGLQRNGLDQNLRALGVLLRPVGRLVTVRHSPAGGPVREAGARLSGSVQPVLYPASSAATVSVTLELPEGVWRDPVATEMASTDLSRINGGVAPVRDPLVLVTASASPVVVTDRVSGSSMTWSGQLRPGSRLLLDPARYRAAWTTGTWEGGSDVSSDLSLSAGGFALTPDAQGRHEVTVVGGNALVRARRAY